MQNMNTIDGQFRNIPEGVCIQDTGRYGLGLFATRDFSKGEIIYCGKCELTEKDFASDINYGHFCVFDVHHGKYQVFGFDRYMNHSCDPCCVAIDSEVIDGEIHYKMMALKDINKGDQLFEDYFHFEFDEAKIIDCQCGAPNCLKTINGFKNLSLAEKLKRVSLCEASLIEKWLADDNTVKLAAPSNSASDNFSDSDLDIVGRQRINQNALENEVNRERSAQDPTLLRKVKNKYMWLQSSPSAEL